MAAAGTVAVLASLLAGRLILSAHGYTAVLSSGAGPTLRAAAGSVLYLTLIALLSLGAATALRDAGVAIAVVLGLQYVLPVVGSLVLSPAWEHRFQRYSPARAAGLAIEATRHLGGLPIGPWQGLGVLAGWAAAALLAGGLLRLRDA